MGTLLGNVVSCVLVLIATAFGFVSFEASAVAYTATAYFAWVFVISSHYVMRPSTAAPFCRMLTPSEIRIYRTYHTYLFFPAGAEAYSAALNLLRIAGIGWAGLCLWKGYYWLGAADIAFFFLSGFIILKMNPLLYMGKAALTGNDVAVNELSHLEGIQQKRNLYKSEV